MRGTTTWSYHPYSPLLFDVGDIYICRLAPDETAIRVEWMPIDSSTYTVFYRRRGDGDFAAFATVNTPCCDITNLDPDTDYELFVEANGKKSRIRIAKTGASVGTVVNYLHPEDEAYAFSGRYLCSPSLVRHPDGFLLASMDLFEGEAPQNLTLIFRSDDDGKSWYYVSDLMPCFWGKLFVHRGALYMLACSTEYGDLLIGRSDDGGRTFGAPSTLLRGCGGKAKSCGVHKNPQNLITHAGRLWGTLEWGSWGNKVYGHAAMMMSCDENADLLDPTAWAFTPPLKFDHFTPALADMPSNTMTIEGTPVVTPDGKVLDVMRFGMRGQVIAYEASTTDPEAPLRFHALLPLDTTYSKFMIKKDPQTGLYFSLVSRLYEGCHDRARNLLSLMYSKDLANWQVACDVLDYRDKDARAVGFQYVDFLMEGEDILFLSRTAINDAHNFHDANYSTFHRIKDFRRLVE